MCSTARPSPGRLRIWRGCVRFTLLAALDLIIAPAVAGVDGFAGSVGVATDYVHRGISQTQGEPSAFLRADYTAENGVYGGVWLGRTQMYERIPTGESGNIELDAYVGYARSVGAGMLVNLQATRYTFPRQSFLGSYDYNELAMALSWRELVSLTYAVADNFLGQDTPSRYGEIAIRYPLPYRFTIAAAAGVNDIRKPKNVSYWHVEFGVSRPVGPLQLDVWYTTTFDDAERIFWSDQTGGRVVAIASFAF